MPQIYGGPSVPVPGFDSGRGEEEAWSEVPEAIVQVHIRPSGLTSVSIWSSGVCIVKGEASWDRPGVFQVPLGKHLLEIKRRSDDDFDYIKPTMDGRTMMEVAVRKGRDSAGGVSFTITCDETVQRMVTQVRLSGRSLRADGSTAPSVDKSPWGDVL